jgi:hypothetical protein
MRFPSPLVGKFHTIFGTHRQAIGWYAGTLLLPIYALRAVQFGPDLDRVFGITQFAFVLPIRVLITLPLFYFGRKAIERATDTALREFGHSHLLNESDTPLLDVQMERFHALRDGLPARIACLAIAAVAGVFSYWRATSASHAGVILSLTPSGEIAWAGWWYCFVAAPVYTYVSMRALAAWVLWSTALIRIPRLPLRLLATHPDGACGVGFLGLTPISLAPVVGATSISLSALWLESVLLGEAKAADYLKPGALFLVVVLVLAFWPFLRWVTPLTRARNDGIRTYGALGSTLAQQFDQNWLRATPSHQPLLATNDASALADFSVLYQRVEQMKLLPIQEQAVKVILAAAILPALPLLLTTVSAEELAKVAFGFLV